MKDNDDDEDWLQEKDCMIKEISFAFAATCSMPDALLLLLLVGGKVLKTFFSLTMFFS